MKKAIAPNRYRRNVAAVAIVGSLVLAACGGGGDGDALADSRDRELTAGAEETEETRDASTDEPDDADSGALQSGEAISHLPFDAEAPTGYRMVANGCEAEAESGDDVDSSLKYTSPISYAVPTEWDSAGRSSGGSGGLLGSDVDLKFNTEDGDHVEVGYDVDSHNGDGEITDRNGDPWKTFDYDYSIGDDTARIEFENVATVAIGDQQVELLYRDPSQAPDHVSGEEYKVRVSVMEMTDPNRGRTEELSLVLNVTFDSDAVDVTQETVESIVGSLSMPTCQWEEDLIMQEMNRNIDLNGDGKIKSREEALAEMTEQLDDMQSEVQEELEEELEED